MADDGAGLNKTLPEAPQWGPGRPATKSNMSDGRLSIDPDNFRPSGFQHEGRMNELHQPPGDPARDSGFAYLNMVCACANPYRIFPSRLAHCRSSLL